MSFILYGHRRFSYIILSGNNKYSICVDIHETRGGANIGKKIAMIRTMNPCPLFGSLPKRHCNKKVQNLYCIANVLTKELRSKIR